MSFYGTNIYNDYGLTTEVIDKDIPLYEIKYDIHQNGSTESIMVLNSYIPKYCITFDQAEETLNLYAVIVEKNGEQINVNYTPIGEINNFLLDNTDVENGTLTLPNLKEVSE